MDAVTLSDIAASQAAHVLAARVLQNQYGIHLMSTPGKRLSRRQLGLLSEHIEAHLEQGIAIDELARLAAMSPFHFCRSFKRTTGLSPHRYVLARRIDLAKRRLTITNLSVQSIAWSIGFENINHFRRQFVTHFGVTPQALRNAVRSSSQKIR
jgi:AraC family transcriptional regulator